MAGVNKIDVALKATLWTWNSLSVETVKAMQVMRKRNPGSGNPSFRNAAMAVPSWWINAQIQAENQLQKNTLGALCIKAKAISPIWKPITKLSSTSRTRLTMEIEENLERARRLLPMGLVSRKTIRNGEKFSPGGTSARMFQLPAFFDYFEAEPESREKC